MYTLKEILRVEVAPALGCTEPSAVALCTAAAASLLRGEDLDSLEIWLDPNIYKNAMAVAIPGAKGAYGIDMAAALGFYCGEASKKMEVLEQIDDSCVSKAERFLKDHDVTIHLVEDTHGIYVRIRLSKGSETSEALVEDFHDNLTTLKHNDKAIMDHPLLCSTSKHKSAIGEIEDYLKEMTLKELVLLVESMDEEDYEFIMEGVRCNRKLAEHGLAFGDGMGVGKTLDRLVREGLLKRDMMLEARIMTSAAADARMSGVKLPAMSSAGSGNHGLTAIVPIWAVKDYVQHGDETDILKAVALSHIITAYIKAHTGRLSAVCGCSIAAGAGAAAGITYLMGGNLYHIAGSIQNLIEDLAGVICDGAKNSCALKLATAAGTAVQSALFSLHGINVKESDGIIASTPEETMKNVGQLSTKGMIETDRTILKILIDKQFSLKQKDR
jgi:L-cysteine desulfidase